MSIIANQDTQFETARSKLIEQNLWVGDQPDDVAVKLRQRWSLRRSLLDDVTKAALHHTIERGGGFEDFSQLANSGIAVIDDLQNSLLDWRQSNIPIEKEWNFWRHERDPLALIKSNKQPHLDRVGIEAAASNYLNLPYRAVRLERTLVDALVAMELYAFSEEMLTPLPVGFRWLPTRSPLQQKHVVRAYIGGQMWGGVILLGGAWFAGDVFDGRIAGTLIALFFANLAWGTIILPFAWRHQAKARAHVRNCLKAMVHTYSELSSDSALSALRLREIAVEAAGKGVAWPGPLFAILDDNIARSGRL